ncbi:hypothetical protein L9F63_004683, partial [Diploptera punctata]
IITINHTIMLSVIYRINFTSSNHIYLNINRGNLSIILIFIYFILNFFRRTNSIAYILYNIIPS